MMFKAIIFAVLAVAVFADEYTVPETKRAEIREMLRQQCKKNGAEDKVDEVENVGKNFVTCVKDLVDVATLQKEIEEAKPNGALDEVFKKYCAKTPQLKACIQTMLDGVVPCVDPEIRGQMTLGKNAADQLIDFVCYKDGDRIALFIAEGGPQCIQSKAGEIRACGENMKKTISTIDQAKSLSLTERCAKFDELQTCIVQVLEKCDTPTPANMLESLAKYIRNSTDCKPKSE